MQLSPEWQVVLACVRTNLQSEECQPLDRALLETVDWDHFTALACRHGIAPLVYHHLHEMTGTDVLPQGALDCLRHSYYGNVVRNALLYKELNRVLDALQGIGTQVIVLKGAALAETVYPHRALRAMGDIDLLVRPEELSRVENRLLALGYALHPHPLGMAWVKAHHYHFVFVQHKAMASAIPLEIHWHLDRPSRPFAIDLEGLWARAVPARIAGVESWVLSPEDGLLYLCLHTCKHQLTSSLRPFCDIAAIIQQYGSTIDWGQLQTRAARWRITPYVYLPLHLARDLVGAAVPDACLTVLKPEGFEARLLSWATAELLEDQDTPYLFPDLPPPVEGAEHQRPHGYREADPVSHRRRRCVWDYTHLEAAVWLLPETPQGSAVAVWADVVAFAPSGAAPNGIGRGQSTTRPLAAARGIG